MQEIRWRCDLHAGQRDFHRRPRGTLFPGPGQRVVLPGNDLPERDGNGKPVNKCKRYDGVATYMQDNAIFIADLEGRCSRVQAKESCCQVMISPSAMETANRSTNARDTMALRPTCRTTRFSSPTSRDAVPGSRPKSRVAR